jgi:PmbA protein
MSHTDLLGRLIDHTLKAGADAADAVMFESSDISLSYRLGKQEEIERSEDNGIGLRAIIGKKQAMVSSSDINEESLGELIERAVAMAKIAPEDPHLTLADESLFAGACEGLEIYDGREPHIETLQEAARATEDAARSAPGITNSEGASAAYSKSVIALATSKGFLRSYQGASHSLSVCVLAGEGTQMERDYDYSIARFAEDVRSPEAIGKKAAEKTLRRLNPRRVKSCKVPVVFDPLISKGLLGTFASAINGASIARGSSFLKDKMGEAIFAPNITIVDDPHIKRGLASKPFDAEGVQGKKREMVKDGVLQCWFLDLRSATQLGLRTTGHATRSLSGAPSPSSTNLHMEPGTFSPKGLIGDIKSGLYVTDVFGMGINTVTGDYSQGAAGFWIENGEITYPVNEITIAGHLLEMFKTLTPANDLEMRFATNAPTVRIEQMTVAGG